MHTNVFISLLVIGVVLLPTCQGSAVGDILLDENINISKHSHQSKIFQFGPGVDTSPKNTGVVVLCSFNATYSIDIVFSWNESVLVYNSTDDYANVSSAFILENLWDGNTFSMAFSNNDTKFVIIVYNNGSSNINMNLKFSYSTPITVENEDRVPGIPAVLSLFSLLTVAIVRSTKKSRFVS